MIRLWTWHANYIIQELFIQCNQVHESMVGWLSRRIAHRHVHAQMVEVEGIYRWHRCCSLNVRYLLIEEIGYKRMWHRAFDFLIVCAFSIMRHHKTDRHAFHQTICSASEILFQYRTTFR